MYVCHTLMHNSYILFCSLHTVGGWGGGQSSMLPQLLSGVPQLSTPSTAHTVSRRKGHSARLGPHPRPRQPQRVRCSRVTPWTTHCGDFNLHGRWNWGFDSGADGDQISWRLNFGTSLRVLSGEDNPRGICRVITHTLGWAEQLINIDPRTRWAENENGGKHAALRGKRVSLLHWSWKLLFPVSVWTRSAPAAPEDMNLLHWCVGTLETLGPLALLLVCLHLWTNLTSSNS